MELRYYQTNAIDALYKHLANSDDNPCIVIPTGGGKTPVMSTICHDAVSRWGGRVLVLAHVKELLEQTFNTLTKLHPDIDVGLYSAGLNEKDTSGNVIVAGIQSVYKKARNLGSFDLVLVDECHLIPSEGDGMYRTFLSKAKIENNNVRLIGLTATPYRLKGGIICDKDNLLNSVCYEIGVKELIAKGYLCNLITKSAKEIIDTSELHVRKGEFIHAETELLMNQEDVVLTACAEIIKYTKDRSSVLIFASGIRHGKSIERVLKEKYHASTATVFGDTLNFIRNKSLNLFKNRKIKYLINVNVLTTGFDAPNIDCVAMLRPTASPGLYYQMVGRGLRLCQGKEDCLILDYGENTMRHGPIDAIVMKDKKKSSGNGTTPAKICPKCNSIIATGYALCPDCGYEFPRSDIKHTKFASESSIISGEKTVREEKVRSVEYMLWNKKNADKDTPPTMRVIYSIGWQSNHSEWQCFSHKGRAKARANKWWKERSNAPSPDTVEEAVLMAKDGCLCKTNNITVSHTEGEKWASIVGYKLGEKPPYREAGWEEEDYHKGQLLHEILDAIVPF